MTTHRALTCTIVLVLAVMGALLRAQSGYDLFQKALATERADGNLRDAIQLYERVVKESASDRRLVAQALLRIAECHEKLGQRDAVNVYQRIVRDFSDQAESAAVARTRLAAGRPTLDGSIGVVKRQVLPEHLNSVVDYLGAVSADGQYVSFVEWPSGDLAVYDFGSKTHRKLTNECTRSCAEFSVFSKDGKRIAYGWWDWKESRNELRVANVTGDPAPRTLVDIEEVENIEPRDWSPDGQWIAVSSRRKDRSAQIGLVRVKDGALSTLKSVGWRDLGKIRFSPDGKYVAFNPRVSDTSDQRDVFVLAVDGSREIPAVTHPGQDVLLGWSPDGMHLLFASDRRGSTDLWALPIASGKPNGEPIVVARDIPSTASLGITQSGAVYVEVDIVDSDISTAAFDFNGERFVGEPAAPVQQWVGSNRQPDWSPDGKYLAYLSFRTVAASQRNIIVIRSLETGQARELTPMLDKFFSPRWSPDSRSFVVMGWNAKGRGVFRIDAETGEVSLLVSEQPGALIGTAVEWSSDGKSVFYSRNSPGSADRMFVRRDLLRPRPGIGAAGTTGRVQPLARRAIHRDRHRRSVCDQPEHAFAHPNQWRGASPVKCVYWRMHGREYRR